MFLTFFISALLLVTITTIIYFSFSFAFSLFPSSAHLLLIYCTFQHILLYIILFTHYATFHVHISSLHIEELNLRNARWCWLKQLSELHLSSLIPAVLCCSSSAYKQFLLSISTLSLIYITQRRQFIRIPLPLRIPKDWDRQLLQCFFNQRRLCICRSSQLSS